MTDWSVQGRGVEVTVVSPEGDVYPFHIASVTELRLELSDAPSWHDRRPPEDASTRVAEALSEASRWTEETFGSATV